MTGGVTLQVSVFVSLACSNASDAYRLRFNRITVTHIYVFPVCVMFNFLEKLLSRHCFGSCVYSCTVWTFCTYYVVSVICRTVTVAPSAGKLL